MVNSSTTNQPSASRCLNCGAMANADALSIDEAVCPHCGNSLTRMARLLSRLCHRMAAVLEVAPASITADTPLIEVASDSLATVEIMLVLDEEFGCQPHEDWLDELQTVGDLVCLVSRQERAVRAAK